MQLLLISTALASLSQDVIQPDVPIDPSVIMRTAPIENYDRGIGLG
jgi:hypothetical protein